MSEETTDPWAVSQNAKHTAAAMLQLIYVGTGCVTEMVRDKLTGTYHPAIFVETVTNIMQPGQPDVSGYVPMAIILPLGTWQERYETQPDRPIVPLTKQQTRDNIGNN